jgi:hypothetical protein
LEEARKRVMKQGVTQEPTEEAAQAKKDKEKRTAEMRKDAMKRQREAIKESGKEETQEARTQKKTTSTKKTSNKKTTNKETSNKETSNRKPRSKKTTRTKEAPIPQGRRKVPTAGDESGCKHSGLRELDVCDKTWITAYVKVGGWLHKKPCIDCAGKSKERGGEAVLDASVLLLLKQKNVAYICNCGPIGHKMEEGEEGKEDYQCDMMLCLPCYSMRQTEMAAGTGSKRKRKKRVNNY